MGASKAALILIGHYTNTNKWRFSFLGAKLACPDRPSIAYVGDGAWGMSMAEVMTCVRENIPAIAVVFNNGQWGAEKKNQVDFYRLENITSFVP